jgi:hypothetical protein
MRAWNTRRVAVGQRCYSYSDPRGHRELVDKTLEHYKNTELEELKSRELKDHKISLWSIRL